jgi:acyl-CoA hydrolase
MKLAKVQFTSAVHLGTATESRLTAKQDGRPSWHITLEVATKDHGERIRVLPAGASADKADYVPIHQVLSYRVAPEEK